MNRVRTLAFFLCFTTLATQAQESFTTMPINLETVLKLSGSSNLKVAEIKAKHDIAVARAIEAKEWFLPTISPGLILMSHNGNAQTTDGTFIEVNKNSFWAGAAVTADWNLGDAVFKSLAAKQEILAADHAWEAEKNKRTLEAIKAFYDLSAAQSKFTELQKIAEKADNIVRQIDIQVEQGIRYKSDVLLAKANLNHIKIEANRAQQEIITGSNELLNILNIKNDVLLVSADSLLVPVSLADTSQGDVNAAYGKRPEIKLYQARMDALTIGRKTTTTGLLLPDINLGLNDGLFGPYFNPLSNQLSYYVGARWDIPLGVLFMRGTKKQYDARLQLQQVYMDQAKNTVRQEVRDAEAGVRASESQMKLAKEALGFANEALNQSMERQKLGTALPLEVFQAQEALLKAQVDNINAISGYNKAQYSLYAAMGNNF